MKWAGVGSRDKGNTLKVKRLCIWTRFLDKLKGSQNIAMLDLFTLVRNPLVAKKKKKASSFGPHYNIARSRLLLPTFQS